MVPPALTSFQGGIHTGCGKGATVAVDVREIDHLSSQETLFIHNRPAGSLCSGKGSLRAGLRETRKMFSFASNTETTQGLISPKAFWFLLLSELLWLDWNCENQNEDLHPLTHSLGRTSIQLGSSDLTEMNISHIISRGIHTNTQVLLVIIVMMCWPLFEVPPLCGFL